MAQAETGMHRATAVMALATAQAETGVQTGALTEALVAALIKDGKGSGGSGGSELRYGRGNMK